MLASGDFDPFDKRLLIAISYAVVIYNTFFAMFYPKFFKVYEFYRQNSLIADSKYVQPSQKHSKDIFEDEVFKIYSIYIYVYT